MNDYQIPHDTQLEEHLIGCMIYEPACIADVVEVAKPRFFYHKAHEILCEKLFSLWQEDEKKVDLEVLSPTLEKVGILSTRIIEIIGGIATTGAVRYSAERLRDLAALRAAVKVGQQLAQSGNLKDTDEIRQAIANAEGQLSKITEATIEIETMSTLKDVLLEYHDDFEQVYCNSDTGITGLSSGFKELDNLTSGFQKSDLIVLAARPSVGKTAIMLQMGMHISIEKNEPLALFSIEMAKKPLAQRMVANVARIDSQRLRSGLISTEEYEKYVQALSYLAQANWVIDDQSNMTVAEIKAKCRRIKRERGLSCIMIDYLGLIQGDPRMSRYDLVSENIRQLKNLARDFDVPVICLCQLSRGVDSRNDKRPILGDLRESGEIEQTADVVAFLHRDDYYNRDSEKKNIIEIIIAKQRNGPTGSVELAFLKQFNRFANLDRGYQQQSLPVEDDDKPKVPDMYGGGKRA